MVEMRVYRVVMNQQGTAFVLLQDTDGDRLLPIVIGGFEARAIAMKLENEYFERPLTHDLFVNTLRETGYEIRRVEITRLHDTVFYGLLHVSDGETHLEIDSRPSDAIALAVRVAAPIYVAEEVLRQAQVLRSEVDESATQERFRQIMGALSNGRLADRDAETDDDDPDADSEYTEDDK